MKFTEIKAEPAEDGQTFNVTAHFEIDGQHETVVVPDVLNPNHPQRTAGDALNAERAAVPRLEAHLSARFRVSPDDVKNAASDYFGDNRLTGKRDS